MLRHANSTAKGTSSYKQLLTKKFFRDNPYLEISTQRFIYSILLYKGMEAAASEVLMEKGGLGAERLKQINQEKELIQSEQNPEVIFQILRKKIDGVNRVVLIKKALEFEEVLLPMVTEKLIQSYNEVFIENSIRLLAISQKDYTPLLKDRYDEILSPYVQSLVCLILGFRGQEDDIPWMLDRFLEMKKLYPGKTHAQGPLLALHELNCRFYKK